MVMALSILWCLNWSRCDFFDWSYILLSDKCRLTLVRQRLCRERRLRNLLLRFHSQMLFGLLILSFRNLHQWIAAFTFDNRFHSKILLTALQILHRLPFFSDSLQRFPNVILDENSRVCLLIFAHRLEKGMCCGYFCLSHLSHSMLVCKVSFHVLLDLDCSTVSFGSSDFWSHLKDLYKPEVSLNSDCCLQPQLCYNLVPFSCFVKAPISLNSDCCCCFPLFKHLDTHHRFSLDRVESWPKQLFFVYRSKNNPSFIFVLFIDS